MRRIPAKIISPALKLYVKHYFKKTRKFKYKGLNFEVMPTVFFPHFTISTKYLVDFIQKLELKNKSFLELGCGTGTVSTFASKNGATVHATDINPAAVENALKNAAINQVNVKSYASDLFDDIEAQAFDFIVINPPYYPKKAENLKMQAWFCGEDFAYFKKLFDQLGDFIGNDSQVFMILSEDCDLNEIQNIASKHNFEFTEVDQKKKRGEWTFIFRD